MTNEMVLQPYLPSLRHFDGVSAPVLIKADQLGGEWIAPTRVYLAHEVDNKLDQLRERIRVLQLRDDYVTACLV